MESFSRPKSASFMWLACAHEGSNVYTHIPQQRHATYRTYTKLSYVPPSPIMDGAAKVVLAVSHMEAVSYASRVLLQSRYPQHTKLCQTLLASASANNDKM